MTAVVSVVVVMVVVPMVVLTHVGVQMEEPGAGRAVPVPVEGGVGTEAGHDNRNNDTEQQRKSFANRPHPAPKTNHLETQL